MNTPPIKLLFVGSGAVGKQYLIARFTTGEYLNTYCPVVFDSCRHTMTVDGRPAVMDIWQVAGQEDYDRLRPLHYPNTDVVLVCFSISSPASLGSVGGKWHPEVRHHLPDTPIVLVGLKSDVRHDKQEIIRLKKKEVEPVSEKEGRAMAKRIGAVSYVECSSKTSYNISAPFYAACRAIYLPEKVKQNKWKI